MRKTLIVLFVVYAGWSLIALAEIVLRHLYGTSPLPRPLADHNGNIAVSGFILFAAYPGALTHSLAQRWNNGALALLGDLLVPVAGGAWGIYFVLMEVTPLYGPNTMDAGDIPASVFGMVCGTIFGVMFQRAILSRWSRRPRRD